MENPIARVGTPTPDTARRAKAAGGAGGAGVSRPSASRPLFLGEAEVAVCGGRFRAKEAEFPLLQDWADRCRAMARAGLEIRGKKLAEWMGGAA
jgi:hypothetical protein